MGLGVGDEEDVGGFEAGGRGGTEADVLAWVGGFDADGCLSLHHVGGGEGVVVAEEVGVAVVFLHGELYLRGVLCDDGVVLLLHVALNLDGEGAVATEYG